MRMTIQGFVRVAAIGCAAVLAATAPARAAGEGDFGQIFQGLMNTFETLQQLDQQQQQEQQQQQHQQNLQGQGRGPGQYEAITGEPRRGRGQGHRPPPQHRQPPPPQPAMVPPVGDPMANALRHIELGHAMQEKARELEDLVRRVVYTVKLYQALNGGVWYRLGLQLNEIYKLDGEADERYVREFIAATKVKRTSGRNALHLVEISAVDDIQGANQTLANNNGKVRMLRRSVATYVDALSGSGGFERLKHRQNVPLDAMMDAYLGRIGEVTSTFEAAFMTFRNMQTAYGEAMVEMSRAIDVFNAQSGLLAADIAKHVATIALEIQHIRELSDMDNSRESHGLNMVLAVVSGIQVISDLSSMMDTLQKFEQTKNWFDANAQSVVAASQTARAELKESVETIAAIRPKLESSWRQHIASIKTGAASQRAETERYERQLREIQKEGQRKAQDVAQSDMAELNALKARPRSLRHGAGS